MGFFSAGRPRWSQRRTALPGREREMAGAGGTRGTRYAAAGGRSPEGLEMMVVGMGCFWGAEKKFLVGRRRSTRPPWAMPGASRRTRPTRRCARDALDTPRRCWSCSTRPRRATRTCSRSSGRRTTRRRVCARATTSGSQYRSRDLHVLGGAGGGGRGVTAGVQTSRWPTPAMGRSRPRSPRRASFFYAEDYHQQYLAKNPSGYCGLGGTGVSCA